MRLRKRMNFQNEEVKDLFEAVREKLPRRMSEHTPIAMIFGAMPGMWFGIYSDMGLLLPAVCAIVVLLISWGMKVFGNKNIFKKAFNLLQELDNIMVKKEKKVQEMELEFHRAQVFWALADGEHPSRFPATLGGCEKEILGMKNQGIITDAARAGEFDRRGRALKNRIYNLTSSAKLLEIKVENLLTEEKKPASTPQGEAAA